MRLTAGVNEKVNMENSGDLPDFGKIFVFEESDGSDYTAACAEKLDDIIRRWKRTCHLLQGVSAKSLHIWCAQGMEQNRSCKK